MCIGFYSHEVQGTHMWFFYVNAGDYKRGFNQDHDLQKIAYIKGGILRNRTSGEDGNGE
jgi:hypothetical protein